jgi:O-antigen/teichoic acid export membrane protein
VPDYDKQPLQDPSPLNPLLESEDISLETKGTANLRNLDRLFVRGVAWTATVKWLTQVLTWGITIAVARLLAPSDYGLVGMAAIYISLFTLFSEFGIGASVVTLQDLTEKQVSQLNTLSFLLGLLGFLISASAAIPLGMFFHSSDLPLVVLVLSTGFLVSGFRTVPYSLLQKALRFKLLASIEGVQAVMQALVTLTLAALGFHYWALVLGMLASPVVATVLTLVWSRHGFSLPRFSLIRRAVHYSSHVMAGRLCFAAYDDSDFIIAGRVLGAAPLGAYALAWTLAHTPLEKLTTLVNRVTPSVFAKIQTDSSALRRYLRNITGSMAMIIFPATLGVALVAPDFVATVLGPKWVGVTGPLVLLAIHAMIRSNVILLTPLLNAIGEEKLVMWNSVLALFVLPASFYVGSQWGTVGIAAVWVIVYPLVQIPLFVRVFRRINSSVSEYLGALWPAISGCIVMAIAVEAWKSVSNAGRPPYVRLGSEVLVGIAVYAAVSLIFHRGYVRSIALFVRAARSVSVESSPVPDNHVPAP